MCESGKAGCNCVVVRSGCVFVLKRLGRDGGNTAMISAAVYCLLHVRSSWLTPLICIVSRRVPSPGTYKGILAPQKVCCGSIIIVTVSVPVTRRLLKSIRTAIAFISSAEKPSSLMCCAGICNMAFLESTGGVVRNRSMPVCLLKRKPLIAAGSPAASISNLFRRLTWAVSHRISRSG